MVSTGKRNPAILYRFGVETPDDGTFIAAAGLLDLYSHGRFISGQFQTGVVCPACVPCLGLVHVPFNNLSVSAAWTKPPERAAEADFIPVDLDGIFACLTNAFRRHPFRE